VKRCLDPNQRPKGVVLLECPKVKHKVFQMTYEPSPIGTLWIGTTKTPMKTDSVKRINESGLRERRFAIRYPFAAEAEILDLKSGMRLSGVTSDLSLGGCFVCTRRPLEVGARVHLALRYKNQSAIMLAAVRVLKPRIGMGLQALELDSSSIGTFLRWLYDLRESRGIPAVP
jgi:hypothetical protein